MELVLNLVWLTLAAALMGHWLRHASESGSDRRMQLVSLVVLIFILLPAISMTDDLLAAQNPAEADCCLRRDHDYSNPHSIFPAVATPPLAVFGDPGLRLISTLTAGFVSEPVVDSPALAAIQNRPPPAA